MNDIMWSEFQGKLRAYVSRRVNASRADDLVSEILLRLVRSQEKMEGATSPMAWVYRVAKNVITDDYRKNAAEKRLLDAARIDPSVVDPPETTADSTALAQCLVPLIKSLPAPYDEALSLTEIEGIPQVEAAKRLGLTVSGMKSRVQRGRQKLKATLLNCCHVEIGRRGDIVDYGPRNDAPSRCKTSC